MNRWRVTHVAPSGRRHRLLVSAATHTSAAAQAELALGAARALSCIRLPADPTTCQNNNNPTPCQTC
ncbi:MAG: hypothetical protein Q7J58_17535 [Hydrogenophaga sp.]|uniref:hypothetical protein n=1 Tax=Hydrogenophaga sp. TaxID=1904254 RepID=UPI00271B055F|nr:hypothetical protein [Hydrogenophaga sp.]MDO9571155.1 hypothetical protein [Hydrogenophaga sp.]MDP3372973.1 hypothetical protein [Hydrogenophaga sp.]